MANQTSPRKDLLNTPVVEEIVPETDDASPFDYSTLPTGVKPGIDGLPMATLVGAIVVGICMWAGIFALISAIIHAL